MRPRLLVNRCLTARQTRRCVKSKDRATTVYDLDKVVTRTSIHGLAVVQ
jgi:hypothetical protein